MNQAAHPESTLRAEDPEALEQSRVSLLLRRYATTERHEIHESAF